MEIKGVHTDLLLGFKPYVNLKYYLDEKMCRKRNQYASQEDLKSGPPLRKRKSKKRFPVLFGVTTHKSKQSVLISGKDRGFIKLAVSSTFELKQFLNSAIRIFAAKHGYVLL